jgi:predicted amidohydrolase
MDTYRVASLQMESVPGAKTANLAKIDTFAAEAARQGARLMLAPECSVTGYWWMRNLSHDDFAALAEPVPDGPSTRALIAMARRHGISVGAGFIERGEDGKLYKPYVVAMEDGRIAVHRKLHAFVHPSLTCGDSYTVFELPGGVKAGILICYDCNLIENVRITALMGAEVLLAPHQTGGCRGSNPHQMGVIDAALWHARHENPEAIEKEILGEKGRGWLMRWLPSRAHDNGIFLVFSNGIGVDDDEIRTGNAMILDPYGRILAESRRAAEDLVVADLDLTLLKQATGRRWRRSRRPELYAKLCERTGDERPTRELKFEE